MASLSTNTYLHILLLREKYKLLGDTYHNDILSKILWYSFPKVYLNDLDQYHQARLKVDASNRRRFRYRRYVREMLESRRYNDIYFCTLTFSNKYYINNSRASRDTYVRKYLNSISADYFCSLDFGDLNGREHYHAIISTSKAFKPIAVGKQQGNFFIPYEKDNCWPKGWFSFRRFEIDPRSSYRTLNYMLKATDYSLKSIDDEDKIKPFHKRGVIHYSSSVDTSIF